MAKWTSRWRNIAQLYYPRSMLLMAMGAAAGLLLAAIGLFTARGTSTLIVPPEDIALVNQQPISRSDFLTQLSTLYNVDFSHSTQAQRHRVLDDMIREELFVQRGVELDVASSDPTVRMAMVSAVEQQSATDAITDLPSDAKLRAYYEGNKSRYSSDGYMTVRDLVFHQGTPPETLKAARAMQPDQAIALSGAKDSGRVNGEEFYFAADIHLGPTLASRAEALATGAVSEPIDLPDGIHLVYMIRNVPPQLKDFDAARAQVLADYRHDATQRMLVHEQVFLRKRANILIADDLK